MTADNQDRADQTDDWRLRGQEEYLLSATLRHAPFRAHGEYSHDHCDFCWAKFMDPDFSEAHRRFIDENPDVRTNGYVMVKPAPGVDYPAPAWVCKQCFDDFRERFAWTLAG